MNREQTLSRERLNKLAWLLDNSIPLPGTGFRIGLDGLLGLLPGVGDTVGALLSSYILTEAGKLGAPRSVLLKMALNVAVDAIFGAIPFFGDLFDFTRKANLRNVRLLESYLEKPRKTVAVSRAYVWGLAAILVVFVLFMFTLGVLAIRWIWLTLTGV